MPFPSAVRRQYYIPQKALTALAGRLARLPLGPMTQAVIRWFIRRYDVNMLEARNPKLSAYRTFNAFFTRALALNARPIASSALVCPVDGLISQAGAIHRSQLLQTKGHSYTVAALLAGDQGLAQELDGGHYACIYLSPKDYHRIHMPCAGTLRSMVYVPGRLFSVNPLTAQHVPQLFARNERVICTFDTAYGSLVLVLVGAMIVGSIATVWHGVVQPPRIAHVQAQSYVGQNISLAKGAEMGRFMLGSTVILLWNHPKIKLAATIQALHPVRLGEAFSEQVA